jgi:protein gp37
MNRQGPGKIEWTDYTLNIVTGCEFGCVYSPDGCYANKLAQRIYPEKFRPTFRPKALKDKDLGKVKAGSKIFLSNMGEAFGPWTPDEWIQAHIDLAKQYPQYIFQVLTKNPKRYGFFEFPPNVWLGATYDSLPLTGWNAVILRKLHNQNIRFVSFEPLLGPFTEVLDGVDWLIIGELTGEVMAQSELAKVQIWAQEIIDQARELKIPVFVKNALGTIFPQREFPKVKQ